MKVGLSRPAGSLYSAEKSAQLSPSSDTYGTGSNSENQSVSGYTRRNGTYVQPHQVTNPNNTQQDNYGTSGNYNPYNGHTGRHGAQY